MAQSGPDKSHSVVSLAQVRERTIEQLSQHFAQDNISLEELESRIERVYQAKSVQDVRELVKDLPADAEAPVPAERQPAPVPAAFAPEEGRIASIMGSNKHRAITQVPRELKLVSIMSETYIDLTRAQFVQGVTEIRLKAIMTSLKIILPPGVRVVFQPSTFMTDAADETSDPPPVGSGAPVVRVTGLALMSEVKVSVRRPERLMRADLGDDELP
jgi:hypothetical protein